MFHNQSHDDITELKQVTCCITK